MNNYINKIIVISIAVLITAMDLFAGAGKRLGTNGVSELLIPVGAKGISTGTANISNVDGIESLFWNPAGLAKIKSSGEGIFNQTSYFADMGITYGAVGVKVGDLGNFSLSIKSLDIGTINVTTVRNPDGTGQEFTPTFLITGLSYAKELSENIAVGITGQYISERIDRVSASTVSFNMGLSYNNLAEVKGLSLGLVMKNLGPDLKYGGSGLMLNAKATDLNKPSQFYNIEAAGAPLPASYEMGLGYLYNLQEGQALQTSASFASNNFQGDEYKVGAEYGYENMFFVRGGYVYCPKDQDEYYEYGLTLGAGINYSVGDVTLKVDYAYRAMKTFDAQQTLGFSLGF